VSKDEICSAHSGSVGDHRGFGKQARLLLAVEEINEQGGVNGRKLKILLKTPPTIPRPLAAQKLVNQTSHDGGPHRTACRHAGAVLSVINFFPITAARNDPLQ
jgi:branched-chain amino acid transport system substrate-binding protein